MNTRVYPCRPVVRDPIARDKLPAEGREVDLSDTYWARRLNDGDITTQAPQGAEKPAKPAAKK